MTYYFYDKRGNVISTKDFETLTQAQQYCVFIRATSFARKDYHDKHTTQITNN